MARLFFALWPDAPAAARLQALAMELADAARGKPVPLARIHLTLAFLGEVCAAHVDEVRAAAAGVSAAPFDVALDRVGSFRQARVAWAGCAVIDPRLAALHECVADALLRSGYRLEDRPFAPHVTLARGIGRSVPGAAIEPIEWQARTYELMRSDAGSGGYTTLSSWDLRR